MTSIDLIRRLDEHRRWANGRARAACRGLSDALRRRRFDIGQGSVHDTLVHLYAAELVWLASIEGDPDPISPFDVRFDTLDDLERAWDELEGRWKAFVDSLTESNLSRPVRKRSALQPDAPPRITPLSDVLMHIALHAQYTLAQLTNMLRHLGVAPLPDMMLISLSREQSMAGRA